MLGYFLQHHYPPDWNAPLDISAAWRYTRGNH